MSRWREFVEDNKGVGSGTSLGFLIVVAALTFCTIFMTLMEAYLEAVSMAGVLAGAAGLTKMTQNWNASSVEKAQFNPDPAPVQPLGPATLINVGQPQDTNGDAPILVPDADKIVIQRKKKGLSVKGKK